jgi:acylglycerol lipase
MGIDVSELRKNFKGPHHLINVSDGKILFLRAWYPSSDSKVAILIFHGITAYSGPYNIIADSLKNEGYNVFGLDLRGHGFSDGIRGDYPSKERIIKDLCETISFLKQKYSKLIIFGHSLGVVSAIIASNHCVDKVDGLILLSAGTEVKNGIYTPLSIKQKLKILLSSIFKPSKPIISYYRDGMTGLNDPIYNFNYTLRFMKIFSHKKIKFPDSLNIPVIVGLGDQDEIFTIDSARNLLNKINSNKKEFFVIQGGKHAEFPANGFKPALEWLNKNFK